jgi:g-D-glutamyl-meso-diaminopimelate peptidase
MIPIPSTRVRGTAASLAMAFLLSLFSLTAVTWAGTPVLVQPKQIYTYDIMVRDMKALAKSYPELISYQTIGKSEYGRDLWHLRIGHGPVNILLNGSHHAREWITTVTLMKMAETMGQNYRSGASWNGRQIGDLMEHVTFHIIPMVNPDGVTLQQKGAAAFPKQDRAALVRMNKGSSDFKRWKANARGIDLNRQYPAGWKGINNPAPWPAYMNYKGDRPLQAKEAQAMAAFTRKLRPQMAVSYHSSGEYVFWNYKVPAKNLERDRKIAQAYSSMTGYRMVKPEPNPSGGGFTDWFITEFGNPGLTPELGRPAGETHVALSGWDRIWKQQQYVPWLLGDAILTVWMKEQAATQVSGEIELDGKAGYYASPALNSGRIGSLGQGRYPVTHKKGSWIEIEAGGQSYWLANALTRPAAPEALEVPASPEAPASPEVPASPEAPGSPEALDAVKASEPAVTSTFS